jgi:UDP-N-acetylmuramoyl-tripeptide--D-alanyl-D-alanine ligase
VLGLQIGLTEAQVVQGVALTQPFEHRMQPRKLNGATLLDDTYNGNLEGIAAGTALLAELPARRKWYVTPGLVDQGADADEIHEQMGRLIATAKPDIVVLMANSAQKHIADGLQSAGYSGELRVETDPLAFYTALPHFVAAGDIVLMQNDWTDNYA